MVKITCPTCGKSYDVTNVPPGKRLRCGKCRTYLVRPDTGAEDTAPEGEKTAAHGKHKKSAPEESEFEITRKIMRTRAISANELPATTIKMTTEELRERHKDRRKR